ncbi:MAG: hypothetical protein GX235_03860 [Clostridiales bacterium]|nr:hypothetical protein [Clostridiales bacterium]
MNNRLLKSIVIGLVLAVTLVSVKPEVVYAYTQEELIQMYDEELRKSGIDPETTRARTPEERYKSIGQIALENGYDIPALHQGQNNNNTSTTETEKPKHTHKYSTKVLKAPTCTEEGEVEYKCECGYSYTEKTDKLEHKYEEKITKEATCEEAGEKTFTCTLCGDTKTEKIPALGHVEGLWGVTKEPTCTEDGENALYCKNCSKILKTEVIKAKGHTAGEWVEEKKPTMISKGLLVQRCTVCNEILEVNSIPIAMTGWYIVIGSVVLAGALFVIVRKINKK